MRVLTLCVLMAVFGAANAFAGSANVDSMKVPATGTVYLPNESVYPITSKLYVHEIDKLLNVEIFKDLVPIKPQDFLLLDGDFSVHTKVTSETASEFVKPSYTVEGTIASLGVEATLKTGDKYLIKGDYRFSHQVIGEKVTTFGGFIPFKMVDTKSNNEYFINAIFRMNCDINGCRDANICFDLCPLIPLPMPRL